MLNSGDYDYERKMNEELTRIEESVYNADDPDAMAKFYNHPLENIEKTMEKASDVLKAYLWKIRYLKAFHPIVFADVEDKWEEEKNG